MTDTPMAKTQLTKRDKILTGLIMGAVLALILAGEIQAWGMMTRITVGLPMILLAGYLAATYGSEPWVPSMARVNAAIGWIGWLSVGAAGAVWVLLIGLWALPPILEKEIAGYYSEGTAFLIAISTLFLAAGIFIAATKYAGAVLVGARDK